MLPEDYGSRALPKLVSPEFEHIKRYWDRSLGAFSAKITPGQYYVSGTGEVVVTVLGSCIAACVRDRRTGIGGMNHFMLPRDLSNAASREDRVLSSAARYGNVAMERLINAILRSGGRREFLECKLFGGARVLNLDSDIGQQNITFINEYMEIEGVQVGACDLGGPFPRKVQYYPRTGKVRVKKLRATQPSDLGLRERAYIEKLEQAPVRSDITLFDSHE